MAQRKNKLKIALIYDFDGTLSPLNMQEYDFLKSLHIEKDAFWAETNELVKKKNANNVLCYMKLMLEKAASKHVPVRYKNFVEFGKSIQLYKGVEQWFDLVNELGRKNDIVVEHYINSSGLTEIIEGSPIAKEFKHVFAGSYLYDENGEAEWPGIAVDFTAKTQYLFKIQKGIFSSRDSHEVNEHRSDEEKRIPITNMVYFGDGETDIPSMKVVNMFGGNSIAVFDPARPGKKKMARKLLRHGRVNFITPASYTKDSRTFHLVCAIIDKIKAENELQKFSTDR